MAFHAVPVTQSEGDVAAAEWKRVGFGIMDRFFQANDKEKIPVDEFLDFLLDKVVLNIVNDPDDPKVSKGCNATFLRDFFHAYFPSIAS